MQKNKKRILAAGVLAMGVTGGALGFAGAADQGGSSGSSAALSGGSAAVQPSQAQAPAAQTAAKGWQKWGPWTKVGFTGRQCRAYADATKIKGGKLLISGSISCNKKHLTMTTYLTIGYPGKGFPIKKKFCGSNLSVDTCYISTKVKNPAGKQRWTVATVGLAGSSDVGFDNAGPLQFSA